MSYDSDNDDNDDNDNKYLLDTVLVLYMHDFILYQNSPERRYQMGKLSRRMINNLFSHTANKGQSWLLGPRLFWLYMIFALFIKNPNSKFGYIF